MAWLNANMSIKVHLYCSLQLSVEKRQIFLDRCTEGWYHYIGIHISNNTIDKIINTSILYMYINSGE